MNRFLANSRFLLLTRWLLGGVFIYASFHKITDLGEFGLSISYYDMIPHALMPLFTTVLAGLEVAVGFTLIAGLWRRGSAFWVSVMLVMFIIALTTAYLRGLSIECGCFTADMDPSRAEDIRGNMVVRILQDIGMLALSLNLLFQEVKLSKTTDSSA